MLRYVPLLYLGPLGKENKVRRYVVEKELKKEYVLVKVVAQPDIQSTRRCPVSRGTSKNSYLPYARLY